MQRRLLHFSRQIDANLINARQKLPAVNQLEQWLKDGVVIINVSGTARDEARAGGNARRSTKANQQIFTITEPASDGDPRFSQVEAALFPNGAADENQRNDVRIVCDAIKYGAILVTNDGGSKSQPGGILGNRTKLADFVRIMSPEEAVEFVRIKIKERDDFNRRVNKEYGDELPPWTGHD